MHKGPTALAVDIAERALETWLAETARSQTAIERTTGGEKAIRELMLVRVREVLGHDLPWAANRRWACEAIRAWASLAALLDDGSKVLEPHLDMLVEFEYGHLLAEFGSTGAVLAVLRADAERLALEIDIATDLADALEPGVPNASGWVRDYRAMSLSLAEYLHRCTVDVPANMPDALAHHYANEVARIQREVREHCVATRRLSPSAQVAGSLPARSASGA